MELTLNNKPIHTNIVRFNQIELSTSENSIKTDYIEISPLDKTETVSQITYKRDTQNGNTSITYAKNLTPKSGINLNFTINPENIIEKCFIDFYTIKNSTNKRNGFYRLEFNDKIFRLYTSISRKYSIKKPIAHYTIDGDLTPGKLSAIIGRMINVIEGYAIKHHKTPITKDYSSFELIETLLYIESCIKESLQDVVLYGNLEDKDKEELSDFLLNYNGFKTKAR